MSDSKPIVARPRLYAMYFQSLMEIAREMGYNLLISGSMNRDLDLVAVPWVDCPKTEVELIQAFDDYLSGHHMDNLEYYMFKAQSGGRNSYVINLNRFRDKDGVDPQYYIDISITPCLIKKEAEKIPGLCWKGNIACFEGNSDCPTICPKYKKN